MLKGRSISHQITCVLQNGEYVRAEGQFLLARGSGLQATLMMRALSHPDYREVYQVKNTWKALSMKAATKK